MLCQPASQMRILHVKHTGWIRTAPFKMHGSRRSVSLASLNNMAASFVPCVANTIRIPKLSSRRANSRTTLGCALNLLNTFQKQKLKVSMYNLFLRALLINPMRLKPRSQQAVFRWQTSLMQTTFSISDGSSPRSEIGGNNNATHGTKDAAMLFKEAREALLLEPSILKGAVRIQPVCFTCSMHIWLAGWHSILYTTAAGSTSSQAGWLAA